MRTTALILLASAAPACADLFVSDYSKNTVYRFDETTGAPIGNGVFATAGLHLPHDVMRLADGTFIVASASDDSVLHFAADGSPIGAFIANNVGTVPAGTLNYPVDFALDAQNRLYLTSQLNNRVVRFDATTGAFIDVFINGGSLNGPSGLAFGQNGDLYVVQRFGGTVLRYSASGSLVGTFSATGFGQPYGIAVNPANGELDVADGNANLIRRIDATDGHTLGTLAIGSPIGVEFGPDGALYAASIGGNQVARYNGASFASFAATGNGSGPNFFTFAVPEPSGAALLLTSAGLLAARRRR